MQKPSVEIPIIDSISELGGTYKVWLCDVWGVIHNGVSAFTSANEACRRFRESGGIVILLTNAPRPATAVEKGFANYGVDPQAYDAIVTSGDVTQSELLSARAKGVFHLGPERDRGLFEGVDARLTEAQDSDLIVCTGLFDDTSETPEDYRALMGDFIARDVPMVCANPDLMVERGEKLIYCAGSLAVQYEEMGGSVVFAGKPHGPIYDLALARASEFAAGPVPRADVLAIGDGLKTDIAGAFRAEIDVLFVASGLHMGTGEDRSALDRAAVERLFADSPSSPRAAISRLAWK